MLIFINSMGCKTASALRCSDTGAGSDLFFTILYIFDTDRHCFASTFFRLPPCAACLNSAVASADYEDTADMLFAFYAIIRLTIKVVVALAGLCRPIFVCV